MKSKKTTYLLLAAVVLIWSLIFIRIFNFKGDKDTSESIPLKITKINHAKINYDSVKLNLNYTDPFLDKSYYTESQKKATTTKKDINKSLEKKKKGQSIVWPKIKFFGLIRSEGKTQGIFGIDGKQSLLLEATNYEEIKIEKIYKDSALVTFNGEERIFKIQ